MLVEGGEVETLRVVYASLRVADRHDAKPRLGKQTGRRVAHLAVALNSNRGGLLIDVQVLECFQGEIGGAAAGSIDTAFGAADVDRLAGDRRGHRVALVHGDRVHDPGHDLGVGAHVGRGDVLLGPDQDRDLRGVAPGQVLELTLCELVWVDRHRPLRSAVGQADRGAFPGHEHRERLDEVEVDVRVIADAALGRAPADVVLHAPAGEHPDRAVVHVHREVHGQLAFDLAQASTRVVGKADDVRRGVEATLCGLESGGSNFDRHVATSDSNSRPPRVPEN